MPEEQAAAKKVSSATPSEAFQPESTIFLRSKGIRGDKMYPVTCMSVNEASKVVVVKALDASPAAGIYPREGSDVSLNSLIKGVLYVANGTVLELTAGKQPKVRVKTQQPIAAIKLRQYPRYLVSGRVSLGEPDAPLSVMVDLEFNISHGGFGLSLPTGNWTGQEKVKFELDMYSAPKSGENSESLGLQLSGEGVIRRRGELPDKPGEEYFGIQFFELDADQQHKLDVWLASVATGLREL